MFLKKLFTIIIITLFFLACFIQISFAQKPPIKPRSLEVDFIVYHYGPGLEYGETYLVGDSFSFEVIITNIGSEDIHSVFTITVFDSERKIVLPSVEIEKKIDVGASEFLTPINPDKSIILWTLERSGSYMIIINSSNPVTFYDFEDENSEIWTMWDDEIRYFIEVASYYDYVLQDRILRLSNAVFVLTIVNMSLWVMTIHERKFKIIAIFIISGLIIFLSLYLGWI
jgi:hypothetical protein